MPAPSIVKAAVWEDSTAIFMARITGADAANITQATISTITCKVFSTPDLSTVNDVGSLTVANVVFDTLQTDSRWTVDNTGYGFRHTMPVASFPTGGQLVLIEYIFTATGGEVWPVVYETTVRGLVTS